VHACIFLVQRRNQFFDVSKYFMIRCMSGLVWRKDSVERSISGMHACIFLVQRRNHFFDMSEYFMLDFMPGTDGSISRLRGSIRATDASISFTLNCSDGSDAWIFASNRQRGAA
jgi:hypothetical protein